MPMTVAPRGGTLLRLCGAGVLAGVLAAAAIPGGGAGALSRSQAQTQAKGYLLSLKDMPSGWKAEGGVTTGGGSGPFPGAKQLANCIGVSSKLITANAPQADSPYFTNPAQSLEVQDSVSVFPSSANAKAELDAIGNAKTPGCMTTLVNAPSFKSKILGSSASEATVGSVSVTRVPSGAYGPGSVGLVLTIPVSSQGSKVTAKLAEVFFVKGVLGHQLSFNSYNATFPTSLAKHLTSLAESRL
jgi:hypothetical protein